MFTPVSICVKDNLFSHVAPSQDKDNGCELCLRPLQDVQGFGQAVTGPGFGPFVSLFDSCQLCAICIVQRTISAIRPNKAALFLFLSPPTFIVNFSFSNALAYFTLHILQTFPHNFPPHHFTLGYWTAAHLKISLNVLLHTATN